MLKTTALLLIGVLIGGPATYLALDQVGSNSGPAPPAGLEPVVAGAAGAEPPDSATPDAGSPAGLDSSVLNSDSLDPDVLDPDVLESLIAEAAENVRTAEPDAAASSYMRDLELSTRLAELAETDPARAASLALSLGLPERFVESAFKLWAEADSDAALAETARLAEPRRHDVAVAMTDVLGAEPATIERIVDVLDTDPLQFQLDALMRLSERAPSRAFDIASELIDPRTRYLAFQDMGAIWGTQDPEGALAAADSAPAPGPGPIFYQRVFQAWSRLDVEGFLDYAAQSSHPSLSAGFAEAALGDPVLALRTAESLPDQQRLALSSEALRVLATRDPAAAVTAVADMPLGGERDRMLRAIASSGRVRISDGQPVITQ